MINLNEKAEQLQQTIVNDRRELHKIPEFGFDIPKTAAYVKSRLDDMGIEYRDCGVITPEITQKYIDAGFPKQERATGVVATIGEGSPCILLRADMDALPMPEPEGSDFASTHPGVMHSCGHDSHTAMLLGAAQILKDNESELQGTVKLMFQIGEEWGYGSKLMIDDGVLENPKVDAAFAIHIIPEQEFGTLQYGEGVTSSSFDSYILTIQGKGGHSSMPQNSVDPNLIATQLFTQLELLIGREVDPAANASLVVGAINGGTSANIIPDTATMNFGTRTYDKEARDHLVKRMPEIVDSMVKMWRGTYDMIAFNTPSTYNNEELAQELKPVFESVMGAENVKSSGGFPASEDFGYISERVPGVMVLLGSGKPGDYGLHNPNMVLNEDIFNKGSALHATVAMNWLKNNG